MKKVVAFVPIRLNSKRVIGKNLKNLGGKPLLRYIFDTLLKVKNINEIYAYCSSEEILPYLPVGVTFLKRDIKFDGDLVLGQDIYDSFCKSVFADIYILAHATSPLIKPESIGSGLNKVLSGAYDSAFSAEKKQTFVWYKNKPLNYSLSLIPRTQDLEPVYIETSAFFMFTNELWHKSRQRIGDNPYIQVVDYLESLDIDYPEDFEIAEKLIHLHDKNPK